MNLKGLNYIGTTLSEASEKSFRAFSPSRGHELEEIFFLASLKELEVAVTKAQGAFTFLSKSDPKQRANFLETIADEIMALGDTLVNRCVEESGLPIARVTGERNRTCIQLKMFAQLLREGSWVHASIDTAQPSRIPLPKPDIRKTLVPLGPVAVFGASNFPLAFSTAGGDTASALAAGCPVVYKAHPSHPGTNELISSAIINAAKKTGMPDGVFSSLQLSNDDALKLVQHPLLKAVGFTGSKKVGMLLFNAAVQREEPIPVYAEMSSVNPVIILEEAIIKRSDTIANDLANSVTLNAGQFCTNPGLVLMVDSGEARNFVELLKARFESVEPAVMLNKTISESYQKSLTAMSNVDTISSMVLISSSDHSKAQPQLFTVDAQHFLKNPSLQNEIFGPATLVIFNQNMDQLYEVIENLEGQLTATIHSVDEESSYLTKLIEILSNKVGRIIFGGYPTGVEVCPSMQHGGPFPSTTDARSTSVGTAAIYRFVRPVAYQNFPDNLLPDELKDDNRLSILRLVNGKWTNGKIE